MYARYVNHLTSEFCYVYPDCNFLNETTEDVDPFISWMDTYGYFVKPPRLQRTGANRHMSLRYGTHRMHKAGDSITKYGERAEMRALGRKAEGESVNTARASDSQWQTEAGVRLMISGIMGEWQWLLLPLWQLYWNIMLKMYLQKSAMLTR